MTAIKFLSQWLFCSFIIFYISINLVISWQNINSSGAVRQRVIFITHQMRIDTYDNEKEEYDITVPTFFCSWCSKVDIRIIIFSSVPCRRFIYGDIDTLSLCKTIPK